jgi:predicted lipoprotein with Yx(FWY)xxD motif
MNNSAQDHHVRPSRRGRPSALAMWTAAATLVFATSLAAIAFAGGTATTIDSASNATLSEQVVVSAQGRTLYALSPETATHLLCKSSECLKFWPPLTVPSRATKLKAGAGVHGTLGILRRAGGTLQVTLRGMPLYRFAGDRAKGQANGQGIKSFSGTWHAVTASSSPSSSAPSAPSSTNTSTGTIPGYEY